MCGPWRSNLYPASLKKNVMLYSCLKQLSIKATKQICADWACFSKETPTVASLQCKHMRLSTIVKTLEHYNTHVTSLLSKYH